jgi:hypothetical protein
LGSPNETRRLALSTAVEPIGRVVDRLGEPAIVARLAAARPPYQMWHDERGDVMWNALDPDINAAMAPLRWRGLLAAERAGAAHQFDATAAIWAWEVDDPEWRAALDAIDVAMAVRALRADNVAVTAGMDGAHRVVLALAASVGGQAAS